MDAPTAAVGDPAGLLDINEDQFALRFLSCRITTSGPSVDDQHVIDRRAHQDAVAGDSWNRSAVLLMA